MRVLDLDRTNVEALVGIALANDDGRDAPSRNPGTLTSRKPAERQPLSRFGTFCPLKRELPRRVARESHDE
jgi:hypothetical protein